MGNPTQSGTASMSSLATLAIRTFDIVVVALIFTAFS